MFHTLMVKPRVVACMAAVEADLELPKEGLSCRGPAVGSEQWWQHVAEAALAELSKLEAARMAAVEADMESLEEDPSNGGPAIRNQ